MANNNAAAHYNRNGVAGNIKLGGKDRTNHVESGGAVSNLNDVCNFLQPGNLNSAFNLPPGACSYDHLVEMIRGLDLQDDGIKMNHKIGAIRSDFCMLVHDENMLCECMDYINDKALADGEMALKFAMLFSSHNFDQLAMKDVKIRSAMLKVLEANYLNADTYRIHDKERLYNSITLLGEYYNRVRLADQSPITILGKSLLSLLIREVSALEPINVKLAKLILSQITLNGDIIRVKHKDELTQLLYHIRRNLIEQPALSATVKALLLMTLDLYYSNFTNLGTQLEQMYTKYLVQDVEDEGNNNVNVAMQPQSLPVYVPAQQVQLVQPQPLSPLPPQVQPPLNTSTDSSVEAPTNAVLENDDRKNDTHDLYDTQLSTKKWSEQVCEDALYEGEFGNEFNSYEQEYNDNGDGAKGFETKKTGGRLSNGSDKLNSSGGNTSRRTDDDSSSRNARRSQKPRNSPRPLKHQQNAGNERDGPHDNQSSASQHDEDQDQTKPLPRWRAPRFNRENEFHNNDGPQNNQQRRFSTSFDDDQSVRSDGGSIRLYSINDRLRHSQEKMERSGSNFNSIANSNWDRQSQHADDRSERSYISNYERGNNYRRGHNRNFNNRQTYDKPPRFQKQQHKDTNIHSNSWRQSRNNIMHNSYHDENSSYRSNGPESNSRSSSRARTLPRPGKSRHFEDADECASNASTYRRSQSPSTHKQHQQQQRSRNFNPRYSSQSSLASEASSTFDRRPRNRNFPRQNQQQRQERWEDTHSVHGQPEDSTWDTKNDNSELVRNARQTAKYMNYLSSKK
ncbi:putative uncharacterized protein DDB_G0282133 [Bactrocera dorsalis]|uniref:CBP80/20-dependent translation initiation factor n=1 Tax=Bactrocera dorsalis TaxID=27457 RepID=A0A034VBB7_BACDO|nr:putative uncharacterized protein DDB_G0282133 [Bactrocera dorsalis]